MSARFIQFALRFFVAAAVLGAAFALAGPVPILQLLGLVALLGAVTGCAVQLYALHEFAPDDYAALRARVAALLSREPAPAMARAA